MILQALVQLADNEQLVPDPDFEIKPVSWVIVLKADGSLVQIESRRTDVNEGTKRKPKWVGNPMLVPRQFYRSGTKPGAYFLVDNAKFVFGRALGKAQFEDQQGHDYSQRFRSLIERCFEVTRDPHLSAVVKFLDFPTGSDQLPLPEEAQANDMFAFQVGTGEPVHLRQAVKEWWKARCRPNEESGEYECLVTGTRFSEIGQFPQVEKVPGAPKPIKLISFNSPAFESYGLERNENATVSELAAIKSAQALNRLLHPAFPDPNDPQRALPARSLRMAGDTAVCFWSASGAKGVQNAIDALPALLQGDSEEDVAEVYRSVWRGKPVHVDDPSAFYVLILSGAQGRAIVRDWIETTLGETMTHLGEHYDDLRVVRNARPKKGSPETPTVPLRWLMESLAAEGKSDATPGSLEAGFLRAAFTGAPYPFQLLQRALVRSRVEAGREEWLDAVRRDARASLIRAVLQRRRRFDSQAQDRYPEVPVSLSPDFSSEGYALGALMAVLERLQQSALGDVNASVVDRYFSAASASPRSVFVRLLKNSRHHARKAADSDDRKQQGFARRLDRLVDYFCSRFDVSRKRYPYAATGIPSHLDLEQQGLFVLGYHQMRHWLWMPKDEREDWEREHADAAAVFRFSRAAEEPDAAVGV